MEHRRPQSQPAGTRKKEPPATGVHASSVVFVSNGARSSTVAGPVTRQRVPAGAERAGYPPICSNDVAAIGAIRCLRRAGLCIPEDVTAAGFSDLPLVARRDIPIFTMRLPCLAIRATSLSTPTEVHSLNP